MGMADVASDVRVMRKEQDSHRYDLRLLKASVAMARWFLQTDRLRETLKYI